MKLIYANDKTTETQDHVCLWKDTDEHVVRIETTGIGAVITYDEVRSLYEALGKFLEHAPEDKWT